jgi:hypothetical protein
LSLDVSHDDEGFELGNWMIRAAGLKRRTALMSFGMWRCPGEQGSNETIFRGLRNPPETKMHSDGLGSDNGVDHVGHYHQPILPPVLQGFTERDSISEGPLGLMARWASRGFKEPNWPS